MVSSGSRSATGLRIADLARLDFIRVSMEWPTILFDHMWPSPVGVFVETFGTGTVPDERIQAAVLEVFDLRPAAIISDRQLLRPIYGQTAAYGHVGRELPDFTWERTDRAEALKAAVGASGQQRLH